MTISELIKNARLNEKEVLETNGVKIVLRHESGGDINFNDMFSITLCDAETDEWILDTGDIHISDLYVCLYEFCSFGKNIDSKAIRSSFSYQFGLDINEKYFNEKEGAIEH